MLEDSKVLAIPFAAGVSLEPHSPYNNQSLLQFSQSVDIILTDSQFQDIKSSTLSSIVQLIGLKSVRIDGLASRRAYSDCPVLQIANTTCSQDNVCVNICNTTTSDDIAGAMYVYNSAITIDGSTFANMQNSDSAISIQNTDGSTISETASSPI